jgi:hypothetical protein
VADQTDISQFIPELGAETGSAQVSQVAPEVGADSSSAQISQLIAEASVGPADSPAEISQLAIESGPSASTAIISQLTIELGRGPEVLPPADSPIGTFTVGAGLGLDWYIALQLSDSGVELRDKVVKPIRLIAKTTRGLVKGYGYGPKEDINVADIEDGVNQKVTLAIADTTQVQVSPRLPWNIKNAMVHTVRVEGIWDGEGIPDRIDEIVYEVARQGIRR